MRVPTRSDGIRSGVNWMRVNVPAQRLGQRRHGQRLAEAGHALEQAVAAGEQGDEHPLEHPVLADDDPAHLEQHLLERGAGLRDGQQPVGAAAAVPLARPSSAEPSAPRRR